MSNSWTTEILVQRLFEIMPRLRMLMHTNMMSLSDNETTILQINALKMFKNTTMTTSDLARMRNVSMQAASTMVQGLVDRGWVERVEDPNDRRRSIIQVTAAGHEREHEIWAQLVERISEVLADLRAEEVQAAQILFGGLDRILDQQNIDNTLHHIHNRAAKED